MTKGTKLSKRQLEMMHWAMEGYNDWEISQMTGLELQTVKNHKLRGRKKLGVKTTVAALHKLFKKGLVWLI
jgi:DNA-binding CsgD family transcriptional regulator